MSTPCHSRLTFGDDHTHEEMAMPARDEFAHRKLLTCRSMTDRRGNECAQFEAPRPRSIGDALTRLPPAEDDGQRKIVRAHRARTSRGALRRAWAGFAIVLSFVRAMLAAHCKFPKLFHRAASSVLAESKALQKAALRQEPAYLNLQRLGAARSVGSRFERKLERRQSANAGEELGRDRADLRRKKVATGRVVVIDCGAFAPTSGAETRAILTSPPVASIVLVTASRTNTRHPSRRKHLPSKGSPDPQLRTRRGRDR